MPSDYTTGDDRILSRFVRLLTFKPSSKETFAEPAHNAAARRFFFHLRRQRIVRLRRTRRARNEKADRRGIGRSGGRRGETRKGLRPPDANLLAEHLSRQIARARELRAPACARALRALAPAGPAPPRAAAPPRCGTAPLPADTSNPVLFNRVWI